MEGDWGMYKDDFQDIGVIFLGESDGNRIGKHNAFIHRNTSFKSPGNVQRLKNYCDVPECQEKPHSL